MKTNQKIMEQDFKLMMENGDYEKYNPTPSEEDLQEMWEASQ